MLKKQAMVGSLSNEWFCRDCALRMSLVRMMEGTLQESSVPPPREVQRLAERNDSLRRVEMCLNKRKKKIMLRNFVRRL